MRWRSGEGSFYYERIIIAAARNLHIRGEQALHGHKENQNYKEHHICRGIHVGSCRGIVRHIVRFFFRNFFIRKSLIWFGIRNFFDVRNFFYIRNFFLEEITCIKCLVCEKLRELRGQGFLKQFPQQKK